MAKKTSISYTEWLKQFKDICINAGIKIDEVHDAEHTPFVDAWVNGKDPERQANLFIKEIQRKNERKKEVEKTY